MGFYEALLGENVCRRRRNTKVFYKGRYVKYPFENGLGELPPEDNLACLLGYVTAYAARKAGTAPRPTNLREWMYHRFGKGITECYLLPYNEKIWKAPAAEMGFDWVDGRVPDPPLEDVIRSSLGIAVAAAFCVALAQVALAATQAVTIEDFDFNPGVFGVAVPPGTAITWTNKGPTVHTTTADNGLWDSDDLAAGQSYSFTFSDPGVYWYFCRPHPFMRGTITIDPNAPAPQGGAIHLDATQ